METPYYLIDEGIFDQDLECFYNAMQAAWGSNVTPGFSVKTNSLPWVVSHIRKKGFVAEVVSPEELELANLAGHDDAHVIYNGPLKSRRTFFGVLFAGGFVNIDSTQEIKWLEHASHDQEIGVDRPVCVGIRVNLNLSGLVPTETLADERGSRFGFCYENGELGKAIKQLRSIPGVVLSGLHLHQTTKSRSPKAFAALAKSAVEIAEKYHLELGYIDMGGGYLGGRSDAPGFSEYFDSICTELRRGFDPEAVSLLAEPGVSVVSCGFSFVTEVKDVKHVRGENYLITDGSRLYLNPQVTRHTYPHHFDRTGGEISRRIIQSQWVTGSTCMEYDRLFEATDIAELLPGDRIIYDTAGGYTMCLAPLFIHYSPAVYVRKPDGSIFTAREAWTNKEFVQKNNME